MDIVIYDVPLWKSPYERLCDYPRFEIHGPFDVNEIRVNESIMVIGGGECQQSKKIYTHCYELIANLLKWFTSWRRFWKI